MRARRGTSTFLKTLVAEVRPNCSVKNWKSFSPTAKQSADEVGKCKDLSWINTESRYYPCLKNTIDDLEGVACKTRAHLFRHFRCSIGQIHSLGLAHTSLNRIF